MADPVLRSRVEDLLYAHAQALDDGPLEDWPALFTPEAHYRLIPWENHARGLPASLMLCTSRAMMEDRVVAIREASVFSPHVCRHLYTNVRVERAPPGAVPGDVPGAVPGDIPGDIPGEPARARANYAVYRTAGDGGTELLSVGRVLARVVLSPEPRFTHMDVVYETFRIPGLLVYPI